MNRLPTLKQLYHLVNLFEHQHFGRAAAASFISQSTMSASIAQLEEIMGVQLIERDHKNFLFTAVGEKIVGCSRKLIEGAQDLMDYAQNQSKPMHGEMRLGCIPTIAPFMINLVVSACKKNYPELKLLIREDTTDSLLKSLEDGEIDVIMFALPYPTKNLCTRILCEDSLQLVFAPQWAPQVQSKSIDLWPDESIFLLANEHCLTEQTMKAFALNTKNKINPFFATSLYTLTQMVSAGLGVSFLPELAIKNGMLTGKDLISMPLLEKRAHRQIAMAWRARTHKHETYQLLADLVKTVIC